jgi:segregation and condensation protein B
VSEERFQQLRVIEAVLFASATPLSLPEIARHLPEEANVIGLVAELAASYANRGVNLVAVDDLWAFRSAPDLASVLRIESHSTRKLTRAGLETLAIIAYHQPVTRAEIEEVRGVALSRGTLDTLLEAGWIRPKGRRRTPGKPVTWGTTSRFLDHFGLAGLDSLPGLDELKAAGLLDTRPALTALGERGLLPQPENGDETDEGEGPDDEAALDDETPLREDFGEDLVAPDADEEPAAGAAPDDKTTAS